MSRRQLLLFFSLTQEEEEEEEEEEGEGEEEEPHIFVMGFKQLSCRFTCTSYLLDWSLSLNK